MNMRMIEILKVREEIERKELKEKLIKSAKNKLTKEEIEALGI